MKETFNAEKVNELDMVINETKRFLVRARKYKTRLQSDKYSGFTGTAEGGACKRASMDLTRALAQLRKSK